MPQTQIAPALFAGHGSPMNAIGDNRARTGWQALSAELEKPRAIVAVSAHWQTRGVCVRTAADNPQICDFYGFPPELGRIRYAPAGDPEVAAEVLRLLGPDARADNGWGLDHGVWTVLSNLFPAADVPVIPVSVDASAPAAFQYRLGQMLTPLRKAGVMVFGSGNAVHNLALVDWDRTDGFGWAETFDAELGRLITSGRREEAAGAARLPGYRLAVPTPEHFYPLLTVLGAAEDRDAVTVWNRFCELGSMSMTSYLFRRPAEGSTVGQKG